MISIGKRRGTSESALRERAECDGFHLSKQGLNYYLTYSEHSIRVLGRDPEWRIHFFDLYGVADCLDRLRPRRRRRSRTYKGEFDEEVEWLAQLVSARASRPWRAPR
jgi:hypothetical protein